MPEVYELDTVTSVLDEIRKPEWAQKLNDFDSIIARRQTAGRGQYRRSWDSPEGNIFAALRLPLEGPFLGTEAAVALGVLLACALRAEGFACFLKWPNDLVLADSLGEARKVCGILLEERENVLFAGIGINVLHAPSDNMLRPDHALKATSLWANDPQGHVKNIPTAKLWKKLVNHLFSSYSHNYAPYDWHTPAQELLLWRNRKIVLADGDERVEGILRGIGFKGELLLEAQGRTLALLSGSIRVAG